VRVAVCCSVLQCVEVCVAVSVVFMGGSIRRKCVVCVAVCCSVLVAVCCSVL